MPVAQDGPRWQLLIVSEEHQEFQNVSLSEHCEVVWESIFKCSPGRFCLVYGEFSEGVDQRVGYLGASGGCVNFL